MATLNAIEQWDVEADVVVAGAGLAGCVTAIEAHDVDGDAEVLLLDKMSERMHGGASRCAAQYLYCPPPEAVDDLCAYQRALNEPFAIPEDVLHAWAEAVTTNRDWIATLAQAAGLELLHRFDRPADFPHLPGAACVEAVYSVGLEGESGVWRAARAGVEQRGMQVLCDAPVVDLVQDGDTLEVLGVLARQGGRTIAVRARRGVVLCVGSFAANFEMQQQYAGHPAMYTMGCPGNTGDGIKLLQKAGAELWHLRGPGEVGGICPAVKVPEFPAAFFRHHIQSSSWIDVAADSCRFYDETADYEATHFKLFRHGHWHDIPLPTVLPVHMVMDERTRAGSQLCLDFAGWNAVAEGYKWSLDNTVEIERGWVQRADTIGELATLVGREPAALEETVARYNAACAAKRDDEYGRAPERLEPIAEPPFYAVEIVPGIGQATAGAVRDRHAQVVGQDGVPIPRLYEAGELGSTLANLYQNGSFLTEAIAFGRIAGRTVVQETPWSITSGPSQTSTTTAGRNT